MKSKLNITTLSSRDAEKKNKTHKLARGSFFWRATVIRGMANTNQRQRKGAETPPPHTHTLRHTHTNDSPCPALGSALKNN